MKDYKKIKSRIAPRSKYIRIVKQDASESNISLKEDRSILTLNKITMKNNSPLVKQYDICILCNMYEKRKRISYLDHCGHPICITCAQNFYELKIEMGEREFHCPIIKCSAHVSLTYVLNVISDKHVITFKLNESQFNKELSTTMDNITVVKYVPQVSAAQVIEVNPLPYGDQCKKCLAPSLYGKFKGNLMKCLNCLEEFCKICQHPIDKHGQNECYINQRGKAVDSESKKKGKVYLISREIFKIRLSYLLIFIFFLFKMNELMSCSMCISKVRTTAKSNTITTLCKILFYLHKTFTIIMLVSISFTQLSVFIILYPFYPLIYIMFNFD